MAIYIIEKKKGKEYHLIEGECKVYDVDKADASGDPKKKDKVKKLKKKFEETRDSPNTHFVAVEISDATAFLGGNTDIHSRNR